MELNIHHKKGKPLRKWLKLEDKLNEKVTALIERLIYLYQKFCPIIIQKLLTNTQQRIINAKSLSISFIKNKSMQTWSQVPILSKRIGDFFGNIQGYLTHVVLSFKAFRKEKGNLKAIFGTLFAVIASYLYEVKLWYSKLQSSTVIVAWTTTTVITFSAYHIYFNGNDINILTPKMIRIMLKTVCCLIILQM